MVIVDRYWERDSSGWLNVRSIYERTLLAVIVIAAHKLSFLLSFSLFFSLSSSLSHSAIIDLKSLKLTELFVILLAYLFISLVIYIPFLFIYFYFLFFFSLLDLFCSMKRCIVHFKYKILLNSTKNKLMNNKNL